jgi:hypothetical protein
MVLMHRKDIIERYGIDPGENASVVPKGDPTAAINVVPDDEKSKLLAKRLHMLVW